MEGRLRLHDKKRGKTGWKDGNSSYIAHRMFEEMGEVLAELDLEDTVCLYLMEKITERYADRVHPVRPRHPDKLTRELADVGNLAMMLADVTFEDFCPEHEDDDDKIEIAMTRQQWDDIINLRGIVIGSVGQKALLELGHALGATVDTSQWPDAKVEA